MPYASNRDRSPTELELERSPWPLPPLNVFLTSGFHPGVYDIRWDDPSTLALNSRFILCGVNVYRSFDSEYGPYERVTEVPVGSTFWRDRTDTERIVDEEVTPDRWVMFGNDHSAAGSDAPRYVFKTIYNPIIKSGSQGFYAHEPHDVQVLVDGQIAKVLRIYGRDGEVEIDAFYPYDPALHGVNQTTFEPGTQTYQKHVIPRPGSRVSCSYVRLKTLVRTDLMVRTYYRITTVGIPINVPLSTAQPQDLIETPLEEATVVSNYEVEKLDYIWREAIRRNRFILEQGGERIRTFIRKSNGVPCPCIQDDYHKQPINDDPTCFVPGTLVNTELGWRPIEEIEAGELVLSSDGMYRAVRQTLKRQYAGSLLSITSSVNTNPIRVTAEHPFLVMRGSHSQVARSGGIFHGKCGPKCDSFIARGDGNARRQDGVTQLPSGNWQARAQMGGSRGTGRVSLGAFSTRGEAVAVVQGYKQEHWRPGHALEWDEARNIKADDWLTAQWFSGISDSDVIRVPQEFLKNTKFGPKRLGSSEFKLDEDFLWVVGIYLAEGSKTKCRGAGSGINFSLHAQETVYQDRLVGFFRHYGFNPSVRFGPGNGAVVTINSGTLGRWFPQWLGDGCANKHIPQELMRLPFAKTWALIRGVHDGDGSKSDKEITQTSEVLALQLVELLHRVGEQPLVRRQRSTKLTPKGSVRKLAYCVSWAEGTATHENRKGRWAFNGRVLARVREVIETSYCGPVYNLEVEGDPTYVVNGIAAHNCYGTGFVGGFDGPYDMIIAPDDAERRIKQSDIGRTVEHTYEVWTGPTPLLRQRDFLVKLNGDRYSVGAVRFPSNRGNILQQHFTIGHIDEKDIRYRVPMDMPRQYSYVEFKPTGPELEASTEITNKPNVPEEVQLRGRTPVWENITYGILLFVCPWREILHALGQLSGLM
jgi:hypothetical protein